MKNILALVFMLSLLSCSAKGSKQDWKQELEGHWILTGIGEKELPEGFRMDSTAAPFLDILVEDMRYKGNDGCNGLMGGLIELDQKIIRFGVYAGTQMMCPDMKIPDLFTRLLGRVQTWKIQKNSLQLSDEEGVLLLQFTKADQPTVP